MVARRWSGTTALAAVLVLGACGGGGGDGGDAPPINPSSATPLRLTAQNHVDAAALGMSAGELALQIGQIGVDGAAKFMAAPAALTETQTCMNGGLVTTSLLDRDGNAVVSAGDRVTIGLQDCAVPLIGAVLSGTITVDISAASGGSASSLQASMSLGDGVGVTPPSGPVPGVNLMVAGTAAWSWSRDVFRTTLTVSSTASDDLRLVASGNGTTLVERFRAMTLSKRVHRDDARSIVELSLRHESDLLGGSITVSTIQPLTAYLNTFPESGQIEILGMPGTRSRVRTNFVLSSERFIAEFDGNGDGNYESAFSVAWTDSIQGYFWWDGRVPLQWSALPYSTQTFSATAFNYTVTGLDAGRVDGDFQLQFSRPLAAGTELKFRFRDTGSSTVFGTPLVDVPAQVESRGAFFVVRPDPSLRHGRNYTLDASADGVNWFGTVIRDTLGNTFSISYIGSITTPDTMRAAIQASGASLSSAAAVIDLNALGSTSVRPIASYQWRQISGVPLNFSAAQSATTQVRWGSTAPTTLEQCVVELTITDSAGEIDSTRFVIAAYDASIVTTLLYYRSAAGDYIGAGQTVYLSDTTGQFQNTWSSSMLSSRYDSNGFPADSIWWILSLSSGDGSPLAVGTYANAARWPFNDGQPGLDFSGSGRGCNQLSGRFSILELQTDSSGVLTKLAVDFEQHCESVQAPPLFGSLRINSARPITP